MWRKCLLVQLPLWCYQAASEQWDFNSTCCSAPRQLAAIPAGHIVGGARSDLLDSAAGAVTAMSYSSQWDLLFVGGDIGTLQAFRGSDLAIALGGNVGSRVTSVTYDHDNGEVVAGGLNGRVVFMQVSTLQSVANVDENSGGSQVNSVAFVAYSDDVSTYSEVASCSYFNSNIRLWSMSAKAVTRELLGHSNVVLALKPLDGLQMLSSGSIDGFLGLWSLPLARLQADGRICSGSTFVPLPTSYLLEDCISAALQQASPGGGDFFVYGQVGSTSANECQLLQNVGACDTLLVAPYAMYRFELPLKHLFKAHDGAIRAIESLPDQGGLVASAGDDGAIHAWSPDTGLKVRDFGSGSGQSALNHGINSIAYSNTLGALVAATLQQLAFFDASTGQLLTIITRSTTSPALSLSMDTWGLVLSSRGTDIEVWPQLTRCPDGSFPSSTSQCDPCPAGRAGTDGFCNQVCGSGSQSTGTTCELCGAGQAGDGQSCTDCPLGEFQDQPGQVNCKQCPRGSAQPNTGQTNCIACEDNSAAPSVGSELCQECPDGTEPSTDHSDCLTCSQGTAGQNGVCNQCQDGEQNSLDFTLCAPCPTGMFGTNGFCSPCPDGAQPDSTRSACVPCSSGFAGTAGVCTRCPPGEEPDAAAAICIACSTGRAGSNGSCANCPLGMVASLNRSVCEFCSDGQAAVKGVCQVCPDGSRVAENRSACLDCADGYAGTGGLCDLCPEGTGASVDRSFCEDCAEGYFGLGGSCTICPNGTEPVLGQNVSCGPCPPTTAGTLGVCMQCPDGTQQNAERTACESCPVGTAGTGGSCSVCGYPLMQDVNGTSCTEQSARARLLYGASRCSEHSCRAHFHDSDLLYCCPTPRGFPLACCDSEVSALATLSATGADFVAAAASVTQVLTCLWICHIWKSESWADWRENVDMSFVGAAAALICVCLHSMGLLWILGAGLVIIAPSTALSILLFAGMHRSACRAVNGIEPMARSRAMKKARAILYAVGATMMSVVKLLGDWIVVHFLLVDFASVLQAVTSSQFILKDALFRPMPYEYVVAILPVPDLIRYPVMLAVRLLWSLQVAISNLPMQVALHSTNEAGIMAAAAMTYATTTFSYVVLASDLPARLVAAKQCVVVGDLGLVAQAARLLALGGLEVLLDVVLRVAGGWPARLLPFVATLLLVPPDGVAAWTPGLPLALALFCTVIAQIYSLCIWVWLIGSSRQIYWTSDLERVEEYLICAVLRALGLWEKEEDEEGPPSAVSSPRSPRSDRGSPRSARSPRSPGAKQESGRSSPGRGSPRIKGPSGLKLKKNLGSVTTLLRRATRGDSPSNSPNSSPRSPRSDGAPSSGPGLTTARLQQTPARFARLADGTRVDIATVRKVESPGRSGRNQSPRSPGRGFSPRSPGRGTSPRNDAVKGADSTRRGMRVNDDWKVQVSPDELEPGDVEHPSQRPRRCYRHCRCVCDAVRSCLRCVCSPCVRLVQGYWPKRRLNKHHRQGLTRRGLLVDKLRELGKTGALIDMWEDIAELGGKQVDVIQLAVLPRPLYNTVPKPKVHLWLRQPWLRLYESSKVCVYTVLGLWKEGANLSPLRVRWRCRELVKQAGRGYLDQEDYTTTQISTAATVGMLLLWLPGCAILSLPARYCNWPPLRNMDSSLDITKHRIQDYVNNGLSYKEAEVALRKYLTAGEKNLKFRVRFLARARRLQKMLSVVMTFCMLALVSPITMGDGVTWAAPLFFLLLFTLAAVHAALDRLLIPWLSPVKITMLSVLRETADEISLMEKVLEAYRSFPQEEVESSEDGEESSDYSSANESFLDEDPSSQNLPEVLGSKKVKILVRPKALRLRMRYELMRSLPASGDHLLRYQREEPMKYGRLLRIPGLLPPIPRRGPRSRKTRKIQEDLRQPKSAAREARTVSFSPTLESDWSYKEWLFRLRRSHSLGTGVAFENKPEEREPRDHWDLHSDIFDEHSRSGIPWMPKVSERMPERGLVDQFEMVGTFKPHVQSRSIKEVALNGLIADTRLGDRLWKTLAAVAGTETVSQDIWQQPVDEALEATSPNTLAVMPGRNLKPDKDC
eukprot:s1524_g6.t2